MVADLRSIGFGYADLSAILGGGYHTYEKLRNGTVKDPRWTTGEKLRKFHQQQMRNKKARERYRKKFTGK